MNREQAEDVAVKILQLLDRKQEFQAELKLVNEEVELLQNASRDETDQAGGAILGLTRVIVIGPAIRYTRLASRPARALLDELVDQGIVDLGRLWDDGILVETRRRGAVSVFPIVVEDDEYGGEE